MSQEVDKETLLDLNLIDIVAKINQFNLKITLDCLWILNKLFLHPMRSSIKKLSPEIKEPNRRFLENQKIKLKIEVKWWE